MTQWANGVATIMPNAALNVAGKRFQFSIWVKGPKGKQAVLSIGWVDEPEPYTFTGDWQYVQRVVEFPADYSGNPANNNLHVHWVRAAYDHANGQYFADSIGTQWGHVALETDHTPPASRVHRPCAHLACTAPIATCVRVLSMARRTLAGLS